MSFVEIWVHRNGIRACQSHPRDWFQRVGGRLSLTRTAAEGMGGGQSLPFLKLGSVDIWVSRYEYRPTGYLSVLNRAGGVGRLRYTDVTAYGVCLLPSTCGMITGWETCGYEGLGDGQVREDSVTGEVRPTVWCWVSLNRSISGYR